MILTQDFAIDYIPRRIVSLVPSQTELLHYLGLQDETIGITKFCVHPKAWRYSKTIVGGTKNVHIAAVKKLQPDLIIANKEENIKEQVEELAKDFTVLVTDVTTIANALQMILTIGQLTGKAVQAATLTTAITNAFAAITPRQPAIPAAYLIWNNPYMTIGGDTFINDMLQHCGLQNVFAGEKRYPVITAEQLQASNCKLVLLSSEPYPFKQKHIDELQQQLPGVKIILVDGEMFSWYGSHMLQAPAYLQGIITGNV